MSSTNIVIVRTFAQIRDPFLPKIMSGELRVQNVDPIAIVDEP